ncbi:hypothetical protein [Streptomyces sp. 6-11-2]|uniref:hypothetical protein n=1 Tax=Streptomyces sp. 6-11-2 TaxID=2585753 RepID=UPI00114223E9|nr:hypothetical protein [Streptomyces sp. 6-11-2]GED86701.1 hypothetical protein TNCT6_37860 [Streptomyces sp. 6-11-2]
MLSYWLATVRRAAVAIVIPGVSLGAFMAGVTIWEDPSAWADGLLQGTLGCLVLSAFMVVVLPTTNTWHAARAVSRHGLTLSAEAVPLPCTAEIRVPIRPGTTAYQLTDSVLHALKQLPAPEIDEVQEFTHGKLTLICRKSLRLPVRFHLSITTDRDTATVTMEARPTATWKILDDGASWTVLKVFEPHVSKAVHDEADGMSAT